MNWIFQITLAAAWSAAAFRGLAEPIAGPPSPELKELLPGVLEKARHERENDRAFEARYVFVKSKVTETRNGSGELKKRVAKVSTNHPALKNLAAPPAPASNRAPGNVQPAKGSAANARAKAYEKEDFQVNEDLLSRFEFSVVGREWLDSRPTLVVDFAPAKRKLPERDLKDKFINKTAGRVWLDEAELTLTKAAIQLTDRVNVVGGLVGSVWKLTFGFERARTPEGLWYTREASWHLEGREVFTPKIMDYHEERTEVRLAQ